MAEGLPSSVVPEAGVLSRCLVAGGQRDVADGGRFPAADFRSSLSEYRRGIAAHGAGQLSAASAAFERATALNPGHVEAWLALADSLRLSGNDAEAGRAYLSSITASLADPQLVEAAGALREGRLETAELLIRRRLRIQPTNVAAIRMMGELAVRLGRLPDAITLLRRACALAPEFDAAREMLARTLQRDNQLGEALAETSRLLTASPANTSVAMLKAALLVRLGDNEAAALVYCEVLEHHPRQTKGWMSYGHVLKAIGQTGEAIAAYRRALEVQPSFGEAWWSLANLKTFKFSSDDVAAMQDELRCAPSEADRFHLLFALGKAFEDDRRDDAAFEIYHEANRLRRASLDYSADETTRRAEDMVRVFSPTLISSRQDGGCQASDPIFIVGLPRSGSTLVEQILASHSMVEGTSELPELMMIAARLVPEGDGSPGRSIAALTPAERTALGEEYLERTRIYRHEAKPRFIDKMPNNWANVGLIRLILPNARIIDVRRHPFATGWSAYKQHFSRGQGFSYDLHDLGRYYADYCQVMRHFDRLTPGTTRRVIYERLVADAEAETRALLDHLGLPFERACLEFWRNQRTIRTPSSEQVRQPINTVGLDQWKRFSKHLHPLTAALGPWLERWDHD